MNRAAALNPRYPVIYYTRYFLETSGARAREQLERAVLLAPNWASPALELVRAYAREMVDLKQDAAAAEARAEEHTQRADQLRQQATEVTTEVSAIEERKRSSVDDADVDDTLEPDAHGRRDADLSTEPAVLDWSVVRERDDESAGFDGGLLERLDEPDSSDHHREAMDAAVKAAEYGDRAASERERAKTSGHARTATRRTRGRA